VAPGTLPTPAIAVAGGNTIIATQTAANGLRFYWNQYGTNTWTGEQVAGNGTTFSAPSIAQNGNSVVIAAQGPNNSLDFYWAANGTSTWHQETVAGPGTTFSAPALTPTGSGVVIAAQGASNSLKFYWALNGTSTWTAEIVNLAGTAYSAPAIASTGSAVDIAVQGPGDTLAPGVPDPRQRGLLGAGSHLQRRQRQHRRPGARQSAGLLLAAERRLRMEPGTDIQRPGQCHAEHVDLYRRRV
jgi:hypothetical protein